MTGSQWQYIIVFLILIGIAVWICYNLFSKKRRKRMSKCPGCSMSSVCNEVRLKGDSKAADRRDKGCCPDSPDAKPSCCHIEDEGQGKRMSD